VGDEIKMVGGVSFEITNQRRSEQIRLRQSKKLELIGQMTGSIAHDFNNVMTVLSCNIPLLNSQRVSPEKRNDLIKDCIEAVGMASNLTNRLMAIARKEPLDKIRVDLNDLLEDQADFLKSSVGQSATLEFSLHEASLPVYVDAVLVEMALLNLVLNSRDAMPEGGAITVATYEAAVDTATPANWGKPHAGPYAILQVRDTGAGMTSEVKEKIFEVFFTTKVKGKGTGLGLSAVLDLAKEAGGFIQIDSEPGKGAAIKVFIPLEDEYDAGNTIGRQLVQP
jgi:signal transduction histidine kinase